MPSFSYRDLIKRLRKLDFEFYKQCKGSHEMWKHSETGQLILVSKHSKNFKTKTISTIAKELGFRNLKDFESFR